MSTTIESPVVAEPQPTRPAIREESPRQEGQATPATPHDAERHESTRKQLPSQRMLVWLVVGVVAITLLAWFVTPIVRTALEDAECCARHLVQRTHGAYHERRGGCRQRRFATLPEFPGVTMPVDESPLTRASLLVQLRDGTNLAAWQEFVRLYGPVVYGFARKRGLQDADAADLMQEVMRAVSAAIVRLDYDRNQGTFRGWLFTISRNKIFNFLSARKIRPQATGDTDTNRLLDSKPDDHDGADVWEMEYQRRLASLAMERIRSEFQEKTWQAFWLTAVEGQAAGEVSKQTGLSTGAIYVAKSRVLARLKGEVEAMQRLEES